MEGELYLTPANRGRVGEVESSRSELRSASNFHLLALVKQNSTQSNKQRGSDGGAVSGCVLQSPAVRLVTDLKQ